MPIPFHLRKAVLALLLTGLLLVASGATVLAGTAVRPVLASVYERTSNLAAPATTGGAVGPSCRFGVAADTSLQSWVNVLSAGWHLNFSAYGSSSEPAEYVPVIRIRQNKQGCTYLAGYSADPPLTAAGLGTIVQSHPGALWLVGNEPDRGPNPDSCTNGQDDVQPEIYAQAYHDIYTFIKRRDPSARIANAGLVQVTPGRLQYLDKVWNAYRQAYGQPWPVDVWNMHLYILPEVDTNGMPNGIASVALGTDPALGIRESGNDKNRCPDPGVYCWAEHDDMGEFGNQVVAMRQWMKARGQQEKPLILSEFSILYPYEIDAPGQCYLADEFGNCFTPTRIRDFMDQSLHYLESAADVSLGYPHDQNRLVQRHLWFSVLTDRAGAASSLIDSSQRLTLLGENYQLRAAEAARTLNLYPASTTGTTLPRPSPAAPLMATLTVTLRNAGSTNTSGEVAVKFYADEALTQMIAGTSVMETVRGCDGNTTRVSVSWPQSSPGKRDYWVVIDPDNVWAETDESDNVLKGTLFVGSAWTFLPNILR